LHGGADDRVFGLHGFGFDFGLGRDWICAAGRPWPFADIV